MTRLPVESRDITPLEGPEYPAYKVSSNCSAPFCTSFSDHAHHIVRRSFLGGDYDWVRLPDGQVFQNKTGLCYLHHKDITENRTQLVYEDGVFLWDNYIADPTPLKIQPRSLEAVLSEGEPDEHSHEGQQAGPQRLICEGCGRPLPKPKVEKEPEEKKVRKTWAVMVPADELEDGADVLDGLLEAARDELDKVGISYGNGSKVKYYPLSTSLALFVQHADKILSDQ